MHQCPSKNYFNLVFVILVMNVLGFHHTFIKITYKVFYNNYSMAKVIIHIGLPKTATTTLQTCLFSELHKMSLVNYIGKKPANKEDENYQMFSDVLSSIILDNDQTFDEKQNETILKADRILKDGILNVISDEVLAMYFCHIDIVMKIKRLKKVFENHDVTLLLSLRKQDELAYSLYVELYQIQFYQDKENDTIDKFIANGLKDVSQGYFLMFCYDKVLEECDNQFGIENTSILLFEDIKTNKAKYHKKLAETLGLNSELVEQCLEDKVTNEKQKQKSGYQSGSVKLDKYLKNVILKNQKLKRMFKVINKGPIKYIFEKLMRSLRNVPIHSKTIPYLTKDQKEMIVKGFFSRNELVDEKYGLGLEQNDFY